MANTSLELIVIPDTWRADTQTCINYWLEIPEMSGIILLIHLQLLATKVGKNPSRQQIKQVSRSLILKYPFMKDDLGSGYGYVSNYMLVCEYIVLVLYLMLQKS